MKKLPLHISRDSCRPRIDYPCTWQYKIIGEGQEEIRRVVEKFLQEKPFTLAESHVSSRGRYVSMNLELIVENDEQRLELYRVLAESTVIRVVL